MKQVVFFCQNPYHLLVSASYSKKIQNREVRKILVFDNTSSYDIDPEEFCPFYDKYIHIPGRWRDGGLIRRQWFKLMYEGYFWGWHGLRKIKCKNIDENYLICFSDFNKIYDRLADMFSGKNDKIVMIEEGIGNYTDVVNLTGNESVWSAVWNRFFLGVRHYSPVYFGMDDRISLFVMKRPDKFPESKRKGRDVLLQEPVDYTVFDEVIEKLLDDRLRNMIRKEKWLLFMGDSFDDEENVPAAVEEACLKKIFAVLSEAGYSVLIKPHPREPKEKYNGLKADNIWNLSFTPLAWLPSECLADKLKPGLVLSPCSSSVIMFLDKEYCKAAGYLYKLFPKPFNIIETYYTRIEQEYEKAHIVKDLEELRQLLAIST